MFSVAAAGAEDEILKPRKTVKPRGENLSKHSRRPQKSNHHQWRPRRLVTANGKYVDHPLFALRVLLLRLLIGSPWAWVSCLFRIRRIYAATGYRGMWKLNFIVILYEKSIKIGVKLIINYIRFYGSRSSEPRAPRQAGRQSGKTATARLGYIRPVMPPHGLYIRFDAKDEWDRRVETWGRGNRKKRTNSGQPFSCPSVPSVPRKIYSPFCHFVSISLSRTLLLRSLRLWTVVTGSRSPALAGSANRNPRAALLE